jgi:hypothetical protein
VSISWGKAEFVQMIAICYPVSGIVSSLPPAARGITFSLKTRERVMYRRAALLGYVRRYGVQSRGDDARPGEPLPRSCRRNVSRT